MNTNSPVTETKYLVLNVSDTQKARPELVQWYQDRGAVFLRAKILPATHSNYLSASLWMS